jgi:hypothetical protein
MSSLWRKHAVARKDAVNRKRQLSVVAGISAALLLLLSGLPQRPVTLAQDATAPAAVPAPAAAATTTPWPLRIDSPYGTINVFEPSPERLDDGHLSARAAISVIPPGETEPKLGAMWIDATVNTDRDARTIAITDAKVQNVRLPDDADREQQIGPFLQDLLPQLSVTFSLDQLTAGLQTAQREQQAVAQLQTKPPKILFSHVPATLVVIDGDPKLQPVEDMPVMRVVNTPFVILLDPASRKYFLKAGQDWLSAPDVTGPWANTGSAPAPVLSAASRLETHQEPQAAQTAPTAAEAPQVENNGTPPRIIVSEEPAELIVTDGQPIFIPLPGNDLLYVSNTQSDLFLDINTQTYYVLLSGRWYRSASLDGPWLYVESDKLPVAFAAIPPDHRKAHVLAFVASTPQAQEAKLDAQVPQAAAPISRDAGQDLNITYDGEPQFQPVEGMSSPVTYAVNSPYPVLCVDRHYYACHQAVWYDSIGAAGPWNVCTSVPHVIYTLPPSCPVYYVRYVYVYDATPSYVYCGYLPGYTGCYVYGPTIVYGTGYVYQPWYRTVYIAYPYTYGFGPRYNSWCGCWGFGATYHWETGWFATDGLHSHNNWWGPQGFVDFRRLHVASAGNVTVNNVTINNTMINDRAAPAVGRAGALPGGANRSIVDVYRRNDNGRRVIDTREVGRTSGGAVVSVEPNLPGESHAAMQPPRGADRVIAPGDGHVYRRDGSGGWEQRVGNRWAPVDQGPDWHPTVNPAPPPSEVAPRGGSTPPAHVQTPPEPIRHERPGGAGGISSPPAAPGGAGTSNQNGAGTRNDRSKDTGNDDGFPVRGGIIHKSEPPPGSHAEPRQDEPAQPPSRIRPLNPPPSQEQPAPPARSQPPVSSPPPSRSDPPSRTAPPAHTEPPARSEPPTHFEPPTSSGPPTRSEPPARFEPPSRAEPPARAEPGPAPSRGGGDQGNNNTGNQSGQSGNAPGRGR